MGHSTTWYTLKARPGLKLMIWFEGHNQEIFFICNIIIFNLSQERAILHQNHVVNIWYLCFRRLDGGI